MSTKELEILREKAVKSIIENGISPGRHSFSFGFSRVSIKARKEQSFAYKKRGVKQGTNSKISIGIGYTL